MIQMIFYAHLFTLSLRWRGGQQAKDRLCTVDGTLLFVFSVGGGTAEPECNTDCEAMVAKNWTSSCS